MCSINLKDGNIRETSGEDSYYKVVSGSLLVYISKVDDTGKVGRKHFLCEIKEKDDICIPSLDIDDKFFGRWKFIMSALEKAELEYCSYDTVGKKNSIIGKFAELLELNLDSPSDFEGELVELIERKVLSEDLVIYKHKQEDALNFRKGLDSIFNVFYKEPEIAAGKTNNRLFNAVDLICKRMKINLLPYETVVEACGKNFTFEDLARVSNFMIRQIDLEDNWYKHDAGCILAFKQNVEDDYCVPVACVPAGAKKYLEYDFERKTTKQIDETIAEAYVKTAYTVYKPLQNRALEMEDVLSFCMEAIHVKDIWLILLLTLFGSLIGLLLPYLNKLVYGKFISWGNESALWQFGGLIIAFTIGNLLFAIVKNMIVFKSTTSVETSLQSAVYDRLFNLPENIYKQYETSDLVERSLSISDIAICAYENIFVSIISVLFSLVYLFMMFAYSKALSIVGIALIIIHGALYYAIGCVCTGYERKIVKFRTKAKVVLHQTLAGIAKVKMAHAENRMLLQYQTPRIEAQKNLTRKKRTIMGSTSLSALFIVLYSIIFYYIIVFKHLNLNIADFLAFNVAFGIFSASALQFVDYLLRWKNLKPSIEKAKLLFELAPEQVEDIQVVGKIEGKIELSNVTFRYNQNENIVLSDISFTIDKGEYIGIVGSSGSGKSTLLRLLMGFEKPISGKVYYDDKDMDLLDKRELRKKFGVVLQDGQLIAGSIYENIVLASNAVSKEDHAAEMQKVWQIIKKVGLEKDISQMPMGIETIVTEGAGTISGGQRQRILIARALFNNPSIIYFDEATSALDNITQQIVSDSLKELNVTRVVIAHRLSTIKDCDRIIVIDKGRVVEAGTYNELMEKKGYYYKMALRQIA